MNRSQQSPSLRWADVALIVLVIAVLALALRFQVSNRTGASLFSGSVWEAPSRHPAARPN